MDQVPVGRAAIDGRVLAHRRDHDPVDQLQPADPQRREQHGLAHPSHLPPATRARGSVQAWAPNRDRPWQFLQPRGGFVTEPRGGLPSVWRDPTKPITVTRRLPNELLVHRGQFPAVDLRHVELVGQDLALVVGVEHPVGQLDRLVRRPRRRGPAAAGGRCSSAGRASCRCPRRCTRAPPGCWCARTSPPWPWCRPPSAPGTGGPSGSASTASSGRGCASGSAAAAPGR